MESTPDTSGYMIAGYAVFFIVSAIYLLSLYRPQSQSPARPRDPRKSGS